jgi:methionyl-tRNA synthetase
VKKFYLTTPIYYVNDVPHIGHAYTTIAADVLARYYRARGADVFSLTGTDEHGAKVAEAAAAKGVPPRQFVDEIVPRFKEAWRGLGIGYDHFIRTSDERHEQGARRFLTRLHEGGDVYKGLYEGLYCVGCERFYQPDELTPEGNCPLHLTPPVQYAEENYFFRLSAYAEALIRAISDPNDPNHFRIDPPARRNEILGKLNAGLQDISISRASLTWGIQLPWDPSQTCYVWIEALMNYVTAVGYGDDEAQLERYWPADLHLMAKDILWFHSVIWPAMLISAGLAVPRRVYAHGFFTINGQKMSKTLGNVIAPHELVDRYGADASRYLLLSEFPFGVDGNVSLDSFDQRFNADLANDLGNLLNRTVSMINRYFGGDVPAPGQADPADRDLVAAASTLAERVDRAFPALEFSVGLEAVRSVVSQANRYVDATQPWSLARSDRVRLEAVLHNVAETLRLIALELQPVMPNATAGLLEQLGLSAADAGERRWGAFPAGRRAASRPTPLFPKLELVDGRAGR